MSSSTGCIREDSSIKTSCLEAGRQLPLVIEPAQPGADLFSWASRNREMLLSELLRCGGLLFRGFGLQDSPDLQRFIRSVSGDPLEYREQSSPRTALGGNIYTSTDYPPEESIAMHCENSYQKEWPLRIFFLCVQPADQGGETPIADVRRVYGRIEKQVLQRFVDKKVMYVRNFGTGLGLSWQQVFQTDDKTEVEAHCRAKEIVAQWNGDQLRTRTIRDAVKKHPQSGVPVWFNHAMFFHVSSLGEEIRETLQELFEPDEMPSNSFYGDGAPIEESVVAHIRGIFDDEIVLFSWQKGDLLMLDNMLVAHGRMPFKGPRRVLVGMAEPTSC